MIPQQGPHYASLGLHIFCGKYKYFVMNIIYVYIHKYFICIIYIYIEIYFDVVYAVQTWFQSRLNYYYFNWHSRKLTFFDLIEGQFIPLNHSTIRHHANGAEWLFSREICRHYTPTRRAKLIMLWQCISVFFCYRIAVKCFWVMF